MTIARLDNCRSRN